MRNRYTRFHLLLVALVASAATWVLSDLADGRAAAQGGGELPRGMTVIGTQIQNMGSLAFVSQTGEIWVYTMDDGQLERHYQVYELGRDLQKLKKK